MLLTVITFLTIVSCYSARLFPRDDNDLTDFQKLKVFSPMKRNLTSPNSKFTQTTNIASTHTRQLNKWQPEGVTKNQYHVINSLSKKTESTTSNRKQNATRKISDLIQGKKSIIFTARPPIVQFFTPSYMEFYYLDESGDHLEKKDRVNAKCHMKSNEKPNFSMSPPNSSFLIFHINGPLFTKTSVSLSSFNIPRSYKSSNKLAIRTFKTVSYDKTHLTSLIPKTIEASNKRKLSSRIITKAKVTKNMSDCTIKSCYDVESTTAYDKIKFFELYDKHTLVPSSKKEAFLDFHYDEEFEINNAHKIQLVDVDQSSHEHKEAKHSKKHILENGKNASHDKNNIEENTKLKINLITNLTDGQTNSSSYSANDSFINSNRKESRNVYSYINKSVSWSKYPFAAVFVYEPSQVHCEAASISPHWLVASGSCLSRMEQSPTLGDGRSAFVAYCGEYWWHPERVSYVKYSVVHPWYHPEDLTRKHLYNIGVIQVVTSMMSACSEWAPVSLMSHQFGVSQGGSEALALGWGLDRYDTRYAPMDLPRASLMIYKSLVFSNSCPGSIGNGVKRFSASDGLKNVYCLSLPPYSGEERDPVHGSLLLIGEKLIALYLQEERRPWGEQSAQYTGIWHLIPWVAEVAKEPEEIELFAVEI